MRKGDTSFAGLQVEVVSDLLQDWNPLLLLTFLLIILKTLTGGNQPRRVKNLLQSVSMANDVTSKRHSPPHGARSPPITPSTTEEDGFTKVLTKEEKRKLRKVERHRPSFSFDVGQFRNGKKIGVAHVRELVLYLVADGQRPLWLVAEVSFPFHPQPFPDCVGR